MLHPAVLKRRNQHEIELVERIGEIGVLLQPTQRGGVQVERRVAVAPHLLAIGFPMVHREGAAVSLCRLDVKLTRRKRKEVCADGACFGKGDGGAVAGDVVTQSRPVGHRPPRRGDLQLEGEPCLQIGLVENRKGKPRSVRDEQRVQELVAPVQRPVTGPEFDLDRVLAHLQRLRRHHHVIVDRFVGDVFPIDLHGQRVGGRIQKIQHHRPIHVR